MINFLCGRQAVAKASALRAEIHTHPHVSKQSKLILRGKPITLPKKSAWRMKKVIIFHARIHLGQPRLPLLATMMMRQLQRKTFHVCPGGACLWAHWGHSQGQGSPSSVPCHRGSFLEGRRTSASRVKGKRKIGPSMLTCPGSIGSVSHRSLCDRNGPAASKIPPDNVGSDWTHGRSEPELIQK